MGSQKHLEERRRRAIELLRGGQGALEVARKVGCARSAVYAWWTAFQDQGGDGLNAKPVPGRPPLLKAGQKKQLTRILLRGAPRFGFSTDLWNTRRVAEVIEKRFGINYHPNHLWRLLQGLGWSCQKPGKRSAWRNEEAIKHWKRYRWPHIKKKPRN